MIYIAHPFTNPDIAVRRARIAAAKDVFLTLARAGQSPFLPTMAVSIDFDETLGRDFWLRWSSQCCARIATSLLVLPFSGWEESQGLMGEIFLARTMHLPILSPADFDLPPPDIAETRAWYGGPAFTRFITNIKVA